MGEISKMSNSIGSCNVSSEDCGLFQFPYVTTITNLEANFEGILGPDHVQAVLSEVSVLEVNMSNETNKHKYLSYGSYWKI